MIFTSFKTHHYFKLFIYLYTFNAIEVSYPYAYGRKVLLHIKKNLCKTATLKTTKQWFSRPIIA